MTDFNSISLGCARLRCSPYLDPLCEQSCGPSNPPPAVRHGDPSRIWVFSLHHPNWFHSQSAQARALRSTVVSYQWDATPPPVFQLSEPLPRCIFLLRASDPFPTLRLPNIQESSLERREVELSALLVSQLSSTTTSQQQNYRLKTASRATTPPQSFQVCNELLSNPKRKYGMVLTRVVLWRFFGSYQVLQATPAA